MSRLLGNLGRWWNGPSAQERADQARRHEQHVPFIQAILEAPNNDDTPRLIYADWLEERGDPRAELIRVQCELARRSDSPRSQLETRSAQLLRRHRRNWCQPLRQLLGLWHGYQPMPFYRGFVSELSFFGSKFLGVAAELFRIVPLRHVRFLTTPRQIRELVGCPSLAWITEATFFCCPMTSEDVSSVLASPHLARLTTLSLENCGLGEQGLAKLRLPGHVELGVARFHLLGHETIRLRLSPERRVPQPATNVPS